MKRVVKILLFLGVISILTGCVIIKPASGTRDSSYYISEKYIDNFSLQENGITFKGGKKASEFFPKYNEIEFIYTDLEFYIFGQYGLDFPNETFVLEFEFDNKSQYLEALKYIDKHYTYMNEVVQNKLTKTYLLPVYDFNINSFRCRVVDDGKNVFPKILSIVCDSSTELIIRFLHCYSDSQDSISSKSFIEGIEKNTYCDWK